LTGIAVRLQQTNTVHDHSRSAVGALERSCIQKRLLYGMQAAIFLKTLDGGNGLSGSGAHRNLARTAWPSSEAHGAHAALPFPAPLLRPGQSAFIAQHVQEPRVRMIADRIPPAVNF